jgi:hypothetical protein
MQRFVGRLHAPAVTDKSVFGIFFYVGNISAFELILQLLQ